MRRWLRWLLLRAVRRITFARTEEFLIRLAALMLLLNGIYKLFDQEIRHHPQPELPRIEQRQSCPTPEESPPKSVFRLL
ncbi:MAG TPA: hypothetical protein VN841_28555 [Bryobacteraceae bacterium]|nr:hypothetical protein [Bryobacteraceae bacterium]